MRSFLLNIFYLMWLSVHVAASLATFWRDPNRLHGFWRKFWGRAPERADNRPVVWIHASSVGEALVVGPVQRSLQDDRPDLNFMLSVMTPDGLAVATNAFPETTCFYSPFDFTWAVRRVYRRLDPCCLIVSESDLWPHMLSEAHRRGIPIAVFNTRMTDSEYRGYQRLGFLLQPAIRDVVWWGAQTEVYAERIKNVFRLTTTEVEVTGSLKFDGVETDRANQVTQQLRRLCGFTNNEKVFVAGSTHGDEEEWAVRAFLTLRIENPDLRLVLVPRNSDRFERVAAMLARMNVPFVRRSQLKEPRQESAPITLFDTIGELRAVWGLAEFAFVGGSLVPHGGQNMIEPCAYGVPTCFGPHVDNFRDTANALLAAGGGKQLSGPQGLLPALRGWLAAPDEARHTGEKAAWFIANQAGAAAKTVRSLMRLLPPTEATTRQLATDSWWTPGGKRSRDNSVSAKNEQASMK